jgi:hypothetical protein
MSNPPGMPGPPPLGLNIDKCIIATVVLKYLKRAESLNSNMKSVKNLDNIKVFRRFVYQRNIKRNLDL